MSEQARPWWASDGPVDGGVDRGEDPVQRLRSARRGDDGPGPGPAPEGSVPGGEQPWLHAVASTLTRLAAAAGGEADPTAPPGDGHAAPADTDEHTTQGPTRGGSPNERVDEDPEPDAGAADPHAAAHEDEVCGICPVCVALRSLKAARPELVGHLTEAARHLSLAARALLEHPGDGQQPHGSSRTTQGPPSEGDTVAASEPGMGARTASGGHAGPQRLQRIDLQ